jgi:diadenylate cyclase
MNLLAESLFTSFDISILDVIDLLLVLLILFQIYRLIRGTAAFSISIAIFFIYVFWLVVKALKMELISSLLGQVIGVGVLALIIVFQQEVRRFLLVMGNRYISHSRFSLTRIFYKPDEDVSRAGEAEEIVKACEHMSARRCGALIVIGRSSSLDIFAEAGEIVDARISTELIETIFFRNTPLHDGAVLIEGGRVLAAGCPLPVSDQIDLPARFGMRHRAALGMSEHSDAMIIVVSEESGIITAILNGEIRENLSANELRGVLLSGKLT